MQATISSEIKFSGVGVHYNEHAEVTVLPADANTGIIFKRTDLGSSVKASYKNIFTDGYTTILNDKNGCIIATIEHLMAALKAYNVTNAIIEINNKEMPVVDGSSKTFCFLLDTIDVIPQGLAKTIKIAKNLEVSSGDIFIKASPSDNLEIDFSIDFPNLPFIKKQQMSYLHTKQNFLDKICDAKTFGNVNEIEMLRKNGMGLGGNLTNTIVLNEDGTKVLNDSFPILKTDFVAHKILDFLGDIFLAECEILGKFVCNKSGHKLNNALLHKIFEDENNFLIIN